MTVSALTMSRAQGQWCAMMMCERVDVHVVDIEGVGLAVSKPACSLGYSMDSQMCKNAHDGHSDPCPHFEEVKE